MQQFKQFSKNIERYFNEIQNKVEKAYKIAAEARKKGYDPTDKVEIPLAKNMAERVEGLISAVVPQIANSGISERIQKLEKKYGTLDWRVALIIADEISEEKFCRFKDKLEAIEVGIRVGFAYLTLGTVSSPLEGFVGIKIKKRRDGKEYFALYYSGPIRSAGGTAAAFSVILADYMRKKYGYDTYDADDIEIKRMITELYDYHEKVTNLQYLPNEKEIIFLVRHLPVQLDGDPSEKIEVSNYKDLDRISTNRIRNGPCLVLGECLAQKAAKLWVQLQKWGDDFHLEHWNFLKNFIELQKKIKSKGKSETPEDKITENYTFIQDLVAGRPVLSFPMRNGGFRLRYGRCRVSGYSAACIHPATSFILNNYISVGTQLKVERPGKATALSYCDSIEGPIVKLKNGSVVVPTIGESKKIKDDIEEILYLGDILFNYGDFYNRAHILVPPGYCEEWWIQEVEKATVDIFGNLDNEKLAELLDMPSEMIENLFKNFLNLKPKAELAIKISELLKVPLHPHYTYYWISITYDQLITLIESLENAKLIREDEKITKLIIPLKEKCKRILELLGIPHSVAQNEYTIIERDYAEAFCHCLGVRNDINIKEIKEKIPSEIKDVLKIVNKLAQIKIMDKAGIFIGARMGRPEKAKMRKLKGSPHVLFPVGEEGGRLRCFQSSLEAGKITAEFAIYKCEDCDKITTFGVCETCNKKTIRKFICNNCGLIDDMVCNKHGDASLFKKIELDIKDIFQKTLKNINFKNYPDLIKGVRGTSNKDHIPEHLAKGILRSNHDVYVNKDGTIRYDMTQVPITHFKPKEIDTSIDMLKKLGYTHDFNKKPLEDNNQIIELMPQDVILPHCPESPDEGAADVLFRCSKFIDEMLTSLYKIKPFYNFKKQEDLIGELVLALAPHTSAGIVGRIIGFTRTQGFYAHPMFHAATRRDCDGDEASIILLVDVFINFSRKFLPNTRGTTQDAPLVLTSRLIPSEVDDMAFDLDVVSRYPLEFYNACLQYKFPWEVSIEQLGNRLNKINQYEDIGFTHNLNDLNAGVRCSNYKKLPSMEEKLLGQMDLAEKIRAVDKSEVAKLVIEKHFLRDIRGNLRKFSQQEFRCVACNEKYRRPPLIGRCIKCKGKIIFTISEGSIIKYLEPAMSLARKFNVSPYIMQSLELTKRMVEGIFGIEKDKQVGLGRWFG